MDLPGWLKPLVEQKRFELSTPTLRTWCSSQLSYCPENNFKIPPIPILSRKSAQFSLNFINFCRKIEKQCTASSPIPSLATYGSHVKIETTSHCKTSHECRHLENPLCLPSKWIAFSIAFIWEYYLQFRHQPSANSVLPEEPWRIVKLQPDRLLPDWLSYIHPELSVIANGRDITAFCRNDNRQVQILYHFTNYGETWFGSIEHDICFSNSKIYSEPLPDGRNYLISNFLYSDDDCPKTRRSCLALFFSEQKSLVFTKGCFYGTV